MMGDYYFLVDASGNATEVSGEIKIGRNKTNELVLSDPLASRHHATVYMDGDTLMVRDENSSNGTFVNKTQIYDPTVLNDQDKIQFGDEEYTVRAPLWDSATIRAPQGDVVEAGATELHAEIPDPEPKKGKETVLDPRMEEPAYEPEFVMENSAGDGMEEMAEPPKKSNRNTIIIIAAVVLVLCLCCLVVVVGVTIYRRNTVDTFGYDLFNQLRMISAYILTI